MTEQSTETEKQNQELQKTETNIKNQIIKQMKKNFKHFVLAALVAISITSCSNDDEQAGGESGGIANGQETAFTLTLSQPKTYATDGNATEEEVKINTVDIFIQDDTAHGNTLNHVSLTIDDFDETAVGSNVYTLKNKIKTTTGVKNILVAINFPADVVADMLSTKDISGRRLVAKAEDLKLPANGFAMSNPSGNITFVADKENKVAVSVLRLLSKVIVKEGAGLSKDAEDGSGTISNIEFAASNVNTEYYPRQLSNSVSPNHSVSVNYFYDATDADYQAVNIAGTVNKGAKAAYILENTSVTNKEMDHTYASIRASFIPNKLLKYESTGDASSNLVEDTKPATARTFYTVGHLYSKLVYFLNERDANAYKATFPNSSVPVTEFKDGICYYNVFLDPDNNYNVVRNSAYVVSLTKIHGLGNPEDKDNGNVEILRPVQIDVDIKVAPWNLVEQEAEI